MHPNIDLTKVVQAFAQFMDVIAIKSHSGRTMLGTECFGGAFGLLALILVIGHEIYQSLYSWARGLDYAFESSHHYELFLGFMAFSIVVVLVRELVETIRTRRSS